MERRSGRSANLCKMLENLGVYFSDQSRQKGVDFRPMSADVIIATAAKSGTTWVQQICHGLRSGGSMDFEEISLVIPCLEMAHDYGYGDLNAEQPFVPRMYKTHFWYPSCPKGAGKYIIVARRPYDAALSFFHFLQGWFFDAGTISVEEFIEDFYLMRGVPKSDMENSSQIHHIWSWYPHRHDENVLWLHYEDLKDDLGECVRLIADFLDIGSRDNELQKLVVHQANFEFMKQHPTKFDEHPLKLARNEASGMPKNTGLVGNPGKLRKGGINEAVTLIPKHILKKIDQKWKAVMTPDTGYESYDAMRAGINKELGRNFS